MRSCSVLLVTTLLLAGCGGSASQPMAGCWGGTSTVKMASGDPVPSWLDNSVLAYPTARVCIHTGDTTSVGYLCGGGQGPQAVITGPSSLSLSSFACPSGGVSRDVGVAIESGNGVLSQGVLTLTVDYVLTYNGQSYPVTFVLDATRTCSPNDCNPTLGG